MIIFTAGDIFRFLCEVAPLELQMDFDNSGFQVGSLNAEVDRALLALDITNGVIDEAERIGAELIISHHPLIFGGLNSVTAEGKGAKTLRLAQLGISAISMHTNLDIAQGGVNDVLLNTLGAAGNETLDEDGCGRIGTLAEPMAADAFMLLCRDKLNVKGLRYYCSGKEVNRLAVMGGAGAASLMTAYKKGCDTYVTADVGYHQFLLAEELGINLIDADHFCTENPVMAALAEKLRPEFPTVEFVISQIHHQTISAL